MSKKFRVVTLFCQHPSDGGEIGVEDLQFDDLDDLANQDDCKLFQLSNLADVVAYPGGPFNIDMPYEEDDMGIPISGGIAPVMKYGSELLDEGEELDEFMAEWNEKLAEFRQLIGNNVNGYNWGVEYDSDFSVLISGTWEELRALPWQEKVKEINNW